VLEGWWYRVLEVHAIAKEKYCGAGTRDGLNHVASLSFWRVLRNHKCRLQK
jgi:hypothetical protein